MAYGATIEVSLSDIFKSVDKIQAQRVQKAARVIKSRGELIKESNALLARGVPPQVIYA